MTSLLLLETIVSSFLVPVCLDDIQLETDEFEFISCLDPRMQSYDGRTWSK